MAHVPHVLLPAPWAGDQILLPRPAAHHLLRVLRLDPGHPVSYTDGQGTIGHGRLDVTAVTRGEESQVPPPAVRLTLAVAPPHERDRLRFLTEKLSELEVGRLTWLLTRFGVHRLPDPVRTAAWAAAGLEQSRGAWLMEIDDAWATPSSIGEEAIFGDREGEEAVSLGNPVTVAIGPEGGWAPDEIPTGARRLSLGRTALRVETAAIAVAVLARRQI